MKAILLFLLNLHLAGIIAADIALIFHVMRLRELVTDFRILNKFELIVAYILLSLWNLVPIFNLYYGLMWVINAFIISDEEFIEAYYEERNK